MSTDRQRILVVDDETQIRRFLRISLTSQGYEVIEAESGGEGLIKAISERPDLVLLDLGLPDIDGQEVLQAIREQSDIPVMVVSVRASESEKVACLDAGANDYITKPFGIQELLARVRATLRQRTPTHASPVHKRLQAGELLIDLADRRITLAGAPVKLTPKEYAVLSMLATYPGRLITQTQLLNDIWGPVHKHDTHYLRIVISKLRNKLSDDPEKPTLIITEPGIGYRLVIDSDPGT
ncbi:response regulator transcription factor [Halomonas sp. McH1-25]|uniref:response regulator n=1 Tax=unclassified Halomonas TaxID=2609666 RepID=UPI001EF3DC5B|nr:MULTISPECIES: response regulator transcription factor [unclassified Halomonas]MCG7601475.1 response regulator transcription factor [Halomonas sp. McH1-25]MCP1344289.1 response regulator transcription factor [Halomonas sp. FL8]MCP1363418.1 response regulator transcription factor [Halomonas sp. BBD45]MCP1366539.1 response regulator transcription factor [Halomonas sp. BBD48]